MKRVRYVPEPTPIEVRLVERFQDLERVTDAYRAQARLAGLQFLVLGAWLAGSRLVGGAAEARLVALAAPLVWAVGAGLSLWLYPRVEPGRFARLTPVGFWIASGGLLALLSREPWYQAVLPRPAALAAAGAALAIVLAVVHVLARREIESWRGLLALAAAIDAARERYDDGPLWGAIGAALLAVGTFRLVRFLWLGRRLRLLQRYLGARG